MERPTDIREVELLGLHGRLELRLELHAGLNIVHGKNGAGKTTLLHAITNLLELDFERFFFIQFHTFSVRTQVGNCVLLTQTSVNELFPQTTSNRAVALEISVNDEIVGVLVPGQELAAAQLQTLETILGKRPVYLPAFRTILEGGLGRTEDALDSPEAKRDFERIRERASRNARRGFRRMWMHKDPSAVLAEKTVICRKWFGGFVPIIRYPSLSELSWSIQEEVQQAYLDLSLTDQQTFSSIFEKVIDAVLNQHREPVESLSEILKTLRLRIAALSQTEGEIPQPYKKIVQLIEDSQKSEQLQSEGLSGYVLKVYEQALSERTRIHQKVFHNIKTFQESVNRFLEGKQLEIDMSPKKRSISEPAYLKMQNQQKASFFTLSSGERHVVTLLYSATHMTSVDGPVLIDEPEISLHLDWQRIILKELTKQVGERQIIVCTHSSEVAADHRDELRELESRQWTAAPFLSGFDVADDSEVGEKE